MSPDTLYHATLAALLTHELDAVKRHEWRVLPLTRWMPERVGEQVFIWCHVPLVLALLLYGEQGETAAEVRLGFAGFAVVHVGLHWAFRKHPAYAFNTPSSWALILLAGGLGAAYAAQAAWAMP